MTQKNRPEGRLPYYGMYLDLMKLPFYQSQQGQALSAAQLLYNVGYRLIPKLTVLKPEEIEKIRPTKEQSQELRIAEESYEPKEFRGLFFNAESLRLTKYNVAQAQLNKSKEQIKEG